MCIVKIALKSLHSYATNSSICYTGISIVFDCSGAGLQSADTDTLIFMIQTLANYHPKGISYILVHELPWLLRPIWHLAKMCIPQEYTQLLKLSNSNTIYEYIDKENLPDFMGGTCERDYRKVPENCTSLGEAAKLWGIEGHIIKKVISRFAEYLPEEALKEADELADKLVL